MRKLITVADWAGDSLNCQEFKSVVEGYLRDRMGPNIGFISSTPSTIHTAFLLSQVIETEERYGKTRDTILFQNTDPRLQTDESVEKAQGAEFVVIRLKSGIFVCGPNAGYDFSLIKDKIDVLYYYPGLANETQFRSRDLYARVCAHLMDGMEDDLDLEERTTNIIPEFKGHYMGHIDNHGNIKTTVTLEELKGKYEYGETIGVRINSIEQHATFSTNLFGAKKGTLVIYPGSSGRKDDPYLEISVWRHFIEKNISTGSQVFGNPRPGTEIKLQDI